MRVYQIAAASLLVLLSSVASAAPAPTSSISCTAPSLQMDVPSVQAESNRKTAKSGVPTGRDVSLSSEKSQSDDMKTFLYLQGLVRSNN